MTNQQRRSVSIRIEPVNERTPEPPPGSVVMVHGLTGTVYQRMVRPIIPHRPWQGSNFSSHQWGDIRVQSRVFLIIQADEE